jgi:hypothetical protein
LAYRSLAVWLYELAGLNLGLRKMTEATNTHDYWQLSRLGRWQAATTASAIDSQIVKNQPLADRRLPNSSNISKTNLHRSPTQQTSW